MTGQTREPVLGRGLEGALPDRLFLLPIGARVGAVGKRLDGLNLARESVEPGPKSLWEQKLALSCLSSYELPRNLPIAPDGGFPLPPVGYVILT